jgi:hypothetical protein
MAEDDGQTTLISVEKIQGMSLTTTLDEETRQVLAAMLLDIGLDKGYCFTDRRYKIETDFIIRDHQTVTLKKVKLVEVKP